LRRVSEPRGVRLLRLYPRPWRQRYESEVAAMLELADIGWRGWVDLLRGAIDARLHEPSRGFAIAALVCGGLWTFIGAGIVAQPVPPDWPGYLVETLPVAAMAVSAGAVAIVGCWARRSDVAGRRGTVAIAIAVVCQVTWAAALLATFLGAADGSVTAAGQAIGVVGVVLIGLTLLATGDLVIGGLLVLAPTLLLFGLPFAPLGYGFAWTLTGFVLLAAPADDQPSLLSTG
jgi:hypothetical protein